MRVGVVGAGAIARFHANAWRRLPVAFAGCFDRNPARAESFCAHFGGRAFASLDDLLCGVDVVDICTHTDGHAAAVLAAAAARIPIVCEKPLARHLHDAEAMIAACVATGTPLFVAQVVRFFPAYVRAHAAVREGVVGKPGVIRTTRAGSFPQAGATFSSPFYADFRRSGGVILDLGIHDIDFQRWIAGDVERVFARGLTLSGRTGMDHAYLVLRFKSGAVGHIDANWALPPGMFRTRLEIAGDGGLIEWDSFQPEPIIAAFRDPAHADQTRHHTASPLAADDDPYFAQLAHFVECLETHQPFRVTPQDALEALRVALAAIESMRTDRPVDIAGFREAAL